MDNIIDELEYFIFIYKAPEDKNGDVDYLNEEVQEIDNPGYGISIRSNDIMEDAGEAQNDPNNEKTSYPSP